MATYTVRGSAHNIVYQYKTEDGKKKQQWETYTTELEALQRKVVIDYLQKGKKEAELRQEALSYKERRAKEKAASMPDGPDAAPFEPPIPPPVTSAPQESNMTKTYREFIEKFLPFYVRKKRLSPNTYDSYAETLKNHVLPYFGDWVMSAITAEDIDNFIAYLSTKPCSGSKRYGKKPSEVPMLSSATIKKCYNVLMVGFPTAKKWKYVSEIPDAASPPEKTKKRKAWEAKRVFEALEQIPEDSLLHLAVHIAFVCSLRAGEVVGIETSSIDFQDGSLWITQIAQRVSDEALARLPKEDIIRVFPKKIPTSRSSMILKDPKTEGSVRKQYLTRPLLAEIRKRLNEIQSNKAVLGKEYHDYGLLLCNPDGTPIDPKSLDKLFKDWQTSAQIESQDQIEFHGLRKSGQMHKVRLTKNNYQLVAENGGQSPEVLMSNYNEALDSEKRDLAHLVEANFYPESAIPAEEGAKGGAGGAERDADAAALLERLKSDPALSQQILQLLLSDALHAS